MDSERDIRAEGPAGKVFSDIENGMSVQFNCCVVEPENGTPLRIAFYTPSYKQAFYTPSYKQAWPDGGCYSGTNLMDHVDAFKRTPVSEKETRRIVKEAVGLTLEELEQRVAVHRAMIEV